MFDKMLKSNNITVMLNTDSNEILKLQNNEICFHKEKFEGKIIFTGQIDELFKYEFGELPYRILEI